MYRRIRELREDRDLYQKDIAEMLKMSQTGYSKYETGENDIPTQVLIKLADFYGRTPAYQNCCLVVDKLGLDENQKFNLFARNL